MKTYGLCLLRGMGYGLLQTYGLWLEFSANQLGGQLKLWGKRGYGLIQVWVKRGLTVVLVSRCQVQVNLFKLNFVCLIQFHDSEFSSVVVPCYINL